VVTGSTSDVWILQQSSVNINPLQHHAAEWSA